MDSKEKVLQTLTDFYLQSHDFNGISVSQLQDSVDVIWEDLSESLSDLVQEGEITLNFSSHSLNPHIKRLPDLPIDEQLEKLSSDDPHGICAYPSPARLEKVVDPSDYAGRPFTLKLALGSAQLDYLSFDLTVLEIYRNDPRYYYTNDDISGTISVYETGMPDRDEALLQSFGFSYDEDLNRAVAVFLRYLCHLSPEHQQIWRARVLEGDYKLHPAYFDASFRGEFYNPSIFSAFLAEMHHINEMCKRMSYPPLFSKEYGQGSKPREFSFLIRPTLREFNAFVHLLDKMISDNLNKDFFRGDLVMENETTRKDGKTVVTQKNTITLLAEWLDLKFTPRSPDARKSIEDMIAAFRGIRKLRQKPAHSVDEDKFDQTYFQKQRELIMRAYDGVRTLRLIFANHPGVKSYKVPDWLDEGKIWTF